MPVTAGSESARPVRRNSRTNQQEPTLWGIHAGKTGDAETLFEKQGVIAIAWDKMGDLTRLQTRDDFKRRFEEAYPGAKKGAIPVSAART